MKSKHRHELETNWLARRLNVAIDRFRPYASTIAGVALALALVVLAWSYIADSSSARQFDAWNAFNQAVIQQQPDVEQLRILAEEHPGTKMQQMADVTWADSQVFLAARNYLYDRAGAMEALEKATSRYQSVLETSKSDRLLNRAQLGMARIHEIRGELDQAREAYLKVKGGNEVYAKAQAERLATPESKEVYAWLAKAQPSRPRSPVGAGTLGKESEFSAGDLALPSETPEAAVPAGTPEGESFEKLLEGLKLDFEAIDETNDPYRPQGTPPAQPGSQPAPGEAPAAQETEATDAPGDSKPDSVNAPSDQPAQ